MKIKFVLCKSEVCFEGGTRLYRIRSVRDFGRGIGRELGGFVEREENLSHDDLCWIADDARVFSNARVYGDAWVGHSAKVYDHARIHGKARIMGRAEVSGFCRVRGNVVVSGSANISERASLSGNIEIFGDSAVRGWLRPFNPGHEPV